MAARETLPNVSICTLTKNRSEFIPLLQKCIEQQNYPLDRLEWLILDDSDKYKHSLDVTSDKPIRIKYQRIRESMRLGAKRNLAHRLCSNEIIVYMDDDDFYFPNRVRHSVTKLRQEKGMIAGSSSLLIYFCADSQIWLSGPFGKNHATAGTFTLSKHILGTHKYADEAVCNEEKSFLKDYTTPMVQLDPMQTMICISHKRNTFDKNRMRSGGETQRMKRLSRELESALMASTPLPAYRRIFTSQLPD